MEIPTFKDIPSPRDDRDLKTSDLIKSDLLLPIYEIDYSSQPVLSQGKKGICTAIALCQMIEKIFGIRLSYAFLYRVGKRVYDQNKNEGSCLRTMLKTAYNYGLPRYELAPYDVNQSYDDFMNQPDFAPEVYADALNHRIGGFVPVSIDKQSIMKGLMNSVYGLYTRVVCGTNWYSDIHGNITWDKAKINPLRVNTIIGGGHAILKRGYDSTNGFMTRDRNTWSDQWCDKGEIDIPEFNDMITEAWIISKEDVVKPFNIDLKFGMSGDEVKNLQKALKIEGCFNYNITGYFGIITYMAVKTFQKQHGIINTGYVGSITRGKLNLIFK